MNEQHLLHIFKGIKQYNGGAEDYLQDYLYPELATIDINTIKQYLYYAHINGYIHGLQPELHTNDIKTLGPLSLTEKGFHYLHSHNFFHKFRNPIIRTLSSVGAISGILSLILVLYFNTNSSLSFTGLQADILQTQFPKKQSKDIISQQPSQKIQKQPPIIIDTKEISEQEIDAILQSGNNSPKNSIIQTGQSLETFFEDIQQTPQNTAMPSSETQPQNIITLPTDKVSSQPIINPIQTAENSTQIRNSFIEDFFRFLQTQQTDKSLNSVESHLKKNGRYNQFINPERLSKFFKNTNNTFSFSLSSFEDNKEKSNNSKQIKNTTVQVTYTIAEKTYNELREIIIVKRAPEFKPLINSIQCITENCSKNPFFR